MGSTSFFNALELLIYSIDPTPDGNNFIVKKNLICRIQLLQGIIVGCLLTKILKEPVKDIWHPIPTRSGIKCISINYQLSGPTAYLRVLFKNFYLKPLLCQVAGS